MTPLSAAPLEGHLPLGALPPGGLTLANVTVIDGSGAPPQGPMDLHLRDGKIASILPAGEQAEGASGLPRYDLAGHFAMPGFIDCHAHLGSPSQIPDVSYAYDLWLGHGVTTVRELGSLGHEFAFTLEQARASNLHPQPGIHPYARFGQGRPQGFLDVAEVKAWLADLGEMGAKGVKLFGDGPVWAHEAVVRHASDYGLRTAFHHSPSTAANMDALRTARWGLTSLEHGYGLAEALMMPGRLQSYLPGHNYGDERLRFIEAGRIWTQCAGPGDDRWFATIDALVESGLTLVPTFTVYVGARDSHRAQDRRWITDFACAELMAFWNPANGQHGSFLRDWGTVEEQIWRTAFERWMNFVHEFASRGGRVAVGADSSYGYSLYGFSFVEELELLVEAGFTPLEVLKFATLHGAELLGIEDVTGTIEVGKQADLVITRRDPLSNLKALYGTGSTQFGQAEDGMSAVAFTLRGGHVYSAPALLESARQAAVA